MAKIIGKNAGDTPGTIKPFAGASVPGGYLACDGSAVSRTTYSALFTALGGVSSPWGLGDLITTFNLPDLRGRTPAGDGSYSDPVSGALTRNRGSYLGAEAHTLTGAQSGTSAHAHAITDPGHAHAITDPGHAHEQRRNDGTGASGGGNPDATWGAQEYGLTSDAFTGITVNSGNTNVTVGNALAANASQAHNNMQPTTIVKYIIKF